MILLTRSMAENISTSEDAQLKERMKFVNAFNKTMVAIWKERITLLDVIDTKTLLNSVVGVRCDADGKFLSINLSQSFRTYGIWQDVGTGKEVPRGNPGDIGRDKMRKARPWFSKKYFASVMNLNEFLANNIGKEFLGIVSDIFDTKNIRHNAWSK